MNGLNCGSHGGFGRGVAEHAGLRATVDVRAVNPFDFLVDPRCKQVPFAYPDGLAGELAPRLDAVAAGIERIRAEVLGA